MKLDDGSVGGWFDWEMETLLGMLVLLVYVTLSPGTLRLKLFELLLLYMTV